MSFFGYHNVPARIAKSRARARRKTTRGRPAPVKKGVATKRQHISRNLRQPRGVKITDVNPPKIGFWSSPPPVQTLKQPQSKTATAVPIPRATVQFPGQFMKPSQPTQPPPPAQPTPPSQPTQPWHPPQPAQPPQPVQSAPSEDVEYLQKKLSAIELTMNTLERKIRDLSTMSTSLRDQLGKVMVAQGQSKPKTHIQVMATCDVPEVQCYLEPSESRPFDHKIQKGERVMLIYPYQEETSKIWVKVRRIYDNGSVTDVWVCFFDKVSNVATFTDFLLSS